MWTKCGQYIFTNIKKTIKGLGDSPKPFILLVPGTRIELVQSLGSRDFKSVLGVSY